MRRLLPLVVAALTLPLLVPGGSADPRASACPDLVDVPVVGMVCPREDGLLELLGPDGRSLGFTHGADPAPPYGPDPVAPASHQRPIVCNSGSAGEYYIQVIYARATDDADGYAARVPTIRALVELANGILNTAAIATGGTADMKVKCASGQIEVLNRVLPTSLASTTFNTIVSDLDAQGHTNGKVKHWVFFDENTCGCGVGHIYNDNTLAVTNLNNGNGVALFAVSFGVNHAGLWLHEMTHNMGGVQKGSPRSTDNLGGSHSNGWHCYDGRDVMCYNDGAPNGGLYSTAYCPSLVDGYETYDCGKDDYFNLQPIGGSWLATKWNVGSTLNRFLVLVVGRPAMVSLACPSTASTGVSFSCTMLAADADSSGIRYNIDWGDGTTECFPAGCASFTTPGVSRTVAHTYAPGVAGTKVVSVTATDNGAPSQTSTALTANIQVGVPVMNLLSCSPGTVLAGSPTTCSFRAADDSSQVTYLVTWGDGTAEQSYGPYTPGTTQSQPRSYSAFGAKTVSVRARDNGAPIQTSDPLTTTVTVSRPAMVSLTCPTPVFIANPVTCDFRADASVGNVRYVIDWGDGTTTTTGYYTPGTTQSAGKTYASGGSKTITVKAQDNGLPVQESTNLVAAVQVISDTTPPTIVLQEPKPGWIYNGCGTKYNAGGLGPATWVDRGCVQVVVTDDLTGVSEVRIRIAGSVVASATTPAFGNTYVFDFNPPGPAALRTIQVEADDNSPDSLTGHAAFTVNIVV